MEQFYILNCFQLIFFAIIWPEHEVGFRKSRHLIVDCHASVTENKPMMMALILRIQHPFILAIEMGGLWDLNNEY
jgi:hypothetical protein